MLRKKENYTNITPIPSHIPRQLALDILHSHSEIITLNPLVLDHQPVKAPRDAEADEFYATWYEITERIQYVPGTGKLGSGKINFKGCFHDMPWGLQTHIYAPAGVDLRNKWQICGNQPGEPVEARELGIGAPREGLYLREDVEVKCNFTLIPFVKAQTKAASKTLVDRLIKKAELLDSGVLHAMMENGKLKTVNPADRTSNTLGGPSSSSPQPLRPQSQSQPQQQQQQQQQPASPGYGQYPQYQQPYSQQYPPQGQYPPHQQQHQHQQQTQSMELPGDYYHPQTSPTPSHLHPSYSNSLRPMSTSSGYSDSPMSNTGRWSDYQSQSSSRPISVTSDASGMKSPGPEQKTFAAELPAMQESQEEHDPHHVAALQKLEETRNSPQPPAYQYNPADYAGVPPLKLHSNQQQ